MKKQFLIVAACLAGAVAGHSQGFVNFENYGPGLDAPVTYSAFDVPVNLVGLTVGGTFRAELAYGIGTLTDPGQLTLVPSSIASFTPGVADGDTAHGAGYWIFGKVTLPGIDAGNSGAVTFKVYAWDTRYGDFGPYSVPNGQSALFTMAVATGNQPIPTFAGHLQPFTVSFGPEPGTLALGGLGAVALFLFRRRR